MGIFIFLIFFILILFMRSIYTENGILFYGNFMPLPLIKAQQIPDHLHHCLKRQKSVEKDRLTPSIVILDFPYLTLDSRCNIKSLLKHLLPL